MVIFLSLLVLAWDDFCAVVQAFHPRFHKPVHPKMLRLYFYYMQQPHDRAAGIVNAFYRRPILVFYLHDRLEVIVQSYHGNINHILDELINVSIQAYSANTLVAQ